MTRDLHVHPHCHPRVTITQTTPTSGSVTTTGSAAFTDQLKTTGNVGPVTYAKTGGGTDITVSSSGKITTTGTLAAGTYTASGTTADAFGDTGTFTYTLTVSAVTITQTTPATGSVKALTAFTDQLNTTGNIGAVTFTTTSTKRPSRSRPAGRSPHRHPRRGHLHGVGHEPTPSVTREGSRTP